MSLLSKVQEGDLEDAAQQLEFLTVMQVYRGGIWGRERKYITLIG